MRVGRVSVVAGTVGALLLGLIGGVEARGSGSGPRVAEQRTLSGPSPLPEGCAPAGSLRGAEASPVALRDGDAVRVLWQQDPRHGAGGFVETHSPAVRGAGGGACSAGGRIGEEALMPSAVVGPDGATWVAVVVNGPETSRISVERDGVARTVEELPAVPSGSTSYLHATIAVDRADPDVVHVAYVRNHFPAGTVALHRVSRDRGDTWSDPHVISAGVTPLGYDFREQLVALGGERLLALSTEVDAGDMPTILPTSVERLDLTQAPVVIRARNSDDGGATWSTPRIVLDLPNRPVRDPAGGTALRSLVHPSVVVEPDGTVLVAAEAVLHEGGTRLLVASSEDGGGSWVVTGPVGMPGLGLHAAVAVDDRGRRALSWLQVDPATTAWQWKVVVHDGTGWSAPLDLSPVFALRPLADSYVGDVGALVGLGSGFAAATVVGTGVPSNPSDIVLTTIAVPGGPSKSKRR